MTSWRSTGGVLVLTLLARAPVGAQSPAAASGLVATAQSTSRVSLLWTDPGAGETGFRVERSLDGSAFTPRSTVGPDVTTYLDASLLPAKLYYYRVVAFSGAADAPPSNIAAATTFSSVKAKVCQTPILPAYPKVSRVSVSNGPGVWAAAWGQSTAELRAEVSFQSLDPAAGTPMGQPVRVTTTDAASGLPTVVWNGTNYGVIWQEAAAVPDGSWSQRVFFALLAASGEKVRGDILVPPPGVSTGLIGGNGTRFPLVWDGSGWGVFAFDGERPPGDGTYFRLDADGDRVLGPVYLHTTPEQEADLGAAWNGSEYGLAWGEYGVTTTRVLFRRMRPDGVLVGGPVELATKPADVALWGASIASPGGTWAVAWSMSDAADPLIDDSTRVYLRRIDSSGNPLGPEVRLSDLVDPEQPPGEAWPVYDVYPRLVARQDGGYSVFTHSLVGPLFNRAEVGLLRTDASGNKVGTRTIVSARDGLASTDFCPASDGNNALVAWADTHLGPLEVAGAILGPSGTVLAGPTDITSGNSAAVAAASGVAAVEEGFALVWTDSGTGPTLIHAQIRDGTGAVVAEKHPLSPRAVSGAAAALGVGDTFAVAWREAPSPAIYFCRYDAAGDPLIPESDVTALGVGGNSPAIAFSGEAYGVAWINGQNVRFQAVRADGSLTGGQTLIAAGGAPAALQVRWIGTGWAILWRASWESRLYVAVVGAGGGIVVPMTAITGTTAASSAWSAWSGTGLGVVWADSRSGIYPDLYFTVLNRDGTKVFPEKGVVTAPSNESPVFLYWSGDRFRLVYSDTSKGLREIEVLPDGSVAGQERIISNRTNAPLSAYNGATVGMMYGSWFQTTACLDDTTPPPCPPTTATLNGKSVHLSWSPVDDPESTVTQYHLYRDGGILAELLPTSSAFDDTGMLSNQVHRYEVRSMNGAYVPSAECTELRFSTVCFDVDADGTLSVADVSYLFDHQFAGGPPPLSSPDADGDHTASPADIFYLINLLFTNGPPPGC